MINLIMRCSTVTTLLLALSTAAAEELRLKPEAIANRAQFENFRISPGGKKLDLVEGLLVENDGAAAGFSYKPNEEVLKEGVVAYKSFDLRDLSPSNPFPPPNLQLLVGFSGKELNVTFNGEELKLGEPAKAGNYWKSYNVDPKFYDSQTWIALSGEGKLWIARDDERNSPTDRQTTIDSRRTEGSKRVETNGLGPNGDIAGEYYVRLYIGGYHKDGTLVTGLFDAANLGGTRIPPAVKSVRSIRFFLHDPDNEVLRGLGQLKKDRWVGIVHLASKSAEPLVELSNSGEFSLTSSELRALPRFFAAQVELMPFSVDHKKSLEELIIRTECDFAADWGSKLKKIAEINPFIVNLRPWFQHESLTHSRLTKLREQYKLDDVVKGCTSDFERMQKLAVWSSQQWTKGHLKDIYPKWDALEILKLHEDGTPIGGFCQQYNLVFLQACQSFGMVGRCVSIGAGDHGVNIRSGHEVVEIWSNELNKWVYVDGQAAWYFVDKDSRDPLNLLELRERQIAALKDKPHRAVDVVVLAKSPYEWKGLKEWPAFCELRMIPHTRFLDGKLPIPLNQGMRGWFWTGHRVWTDDLMPASILYDKRITNPRDWNFTVNQTQFWLTQREKEGELDVKLAHNMPSFSHFVVKIGEGEEQTIKEDNVVWPLAKGENRLQVQAVNVRGLRGPLSWAKVKFD